MLEVTHLLAKHAHIIQVNSSIHTCIHLVLQSLQSLPNLTKRSRAPADTQTRLSHKGPFDCLGSVGGRVGVLGWLVWLKHHNTSSTLFQPTCASCCGKDTSTHSLTHTNTQPLCTRACNLSPSLPPCKHNRRMEACHDSAGSGAGDPVLKNVHSFISRLLQFLFLPLLPPWNNNNKILWLLY